VQGFSNFLSVSYAPIGRILQLILLFVNPYLFFSKSYIAAGDITGGTEKDLLYGCKRRNPIKNHRRHSRAIDAARSIDRRPKEANERITIGYGRMDTVYLIWLRESTSATLSNKRICRYTNYVGLITRRSQVRVLSLLV